MFFGLLKEEDAQCFSVQSSIEDGAFVLAAGAVHLALLNTLVTKAVSQYMREKTQLEKQIEEVCCEEAFEDADEVQQGNAPESKGIHPVPVLFTDTFRWLLRGDDRVVSSATSFEMQSNVPKSSTGEESSHEEENFSTSSHWSVAMDGETDVERASASLGDQDCDPTVRSDAHSMVSTNMCGLTVSPREHDAPRRLSRSLNNRPDLGDVGVL